MADSISGLRTIRVSPSRWRRSIGAAGDSRQSTTSSSPVYPIMEAVKLAPNSDNLVFQFPFPPEQVSYSAVGPEMVEIPRPGRKPLVLWAGPKAKRVRFQFLVALPNDGMFIDVEDALKTLSEIAQSARPVFFTNADNFLGAPGSYGGGSLTFWTIFDLSFDSQRRNAAQRITSARCTIDLVENTNPQLDVVKLAPIEYTELVPIKNPLPDDEPAEELRDYVNVAGPADLAWGSVYRELDALGEI